ncbi:MAG: hypothetical protein MJY72_01920 [Bacteroidales bacterium]|nr:hypothetical protein [Bacteroidales bacterium]
MAAYRKYGTCFFERYAITSLRTLLGHKFDDLINEDRPDLQSADRKRLGIEVTRAMDPGKAAANQMLKGLAGFPRQDGVPGYDEVIEKGYGYGIHEGKYIGGLELRYWQGAKPLRDIIANKVGKVSSGFYGNFDEFGLFVFCKDPLDEELVHKTVRYIMNLQKDNEVRYRRLFLSEAGGLYACNLDDDISFEFRITYCPVSSELRREFYLEALEY